MRVAIIVPALAHSGPELVIKYLSDELSKNDKFKVRIYYLDKKIDPELELSVPVERLSAWRFPFSDFDIIHTNGLRPDLFAYLNRKKIKYHISTIHNFVFKDLSFRYSWSVSLLIATLWLILWKRADKLICVSAAMKDYYLKWFPESKLAVIHNGIPQNIIVSNPDNSIIKKIDHFHSLGYIVIGVACNLNRGKGIEILLKQLETVNDFAVVIIGTGPELNNLQEMTQKLMINNRCYFSGFKTCAVNYFKYLDLFVVPSLSEGFCLSLVEAVQQKIPVICSDLPVFRELFNEREVTFFKPNDLNSLATALQASEKTGKSKIELAYNRFINNYTSRSMVNKYIELYQSA
jgi:glycosyltransferase involved in cell wall biosynthesis